MGVSVVYRWDRGFSELETWLVQGYERTADVFGTGASQMGVMREAETCFGAKPIVRFGWKTRSSAQHREEQTVTHRDQRCTQVARFE